jgi:hypothetical protein
LIEKLAGFKTEPPYQFLGYWSDNTLQSQITDQHPGEDSPGFVNIYMLNSSYWNPSNGKGTGGAYGNETVYQYGDLSGRYARGTGWSLCNKACP